MNCLKPIALSSGLLVPCGRCPRCRKNHQRDWTFRLKAERDASDITLWLTLTLDTEHLPLLQGIPVVDRKQPRHFVEALRKHYGIKMRFKHFLVSEYGDGFDRPHYHCLLFVKLPDGSRVIDVINARKDLLEYICGEHSTAWPYGFAYNKRLHNNVFGYVTNYVNKPEIIDPEHPHPVRPFTCISNGIGIDFMQRFDTAQFEDLNFVVSYDGSNKVLPRYYRDKFYPHSSVAVCKAFADGDTALAEKIAENVRNWNEKMESQVYPRNYRKATTKMLDYERAHSIDYATYLQGVAAREQRQYVEQLKKRKSL